MKRKPKPPAPPPVTPELAPTPLEALPAYLGDLLRYAENQPPAPTGDPCEHITWRAFLPRATDLSIPENILQAAIDLASSPLVAIARRIQDEPKAKDRQVLLDLFKARLEASSGMAGHMPRIAHALERIADTGNAQHLAILDEPQGVFSKYR